MTLSEAVAKRAKLNAEGVKCQIKHYGDGFWHLLIAGRDY